MHPFPAVILGANHVICTDGLENCVRLAKENILHAAEEIEMNELIDSGVLVIAAAGNSGNCCSNPVMYPASYQQLMSVAALKSNTEIASFSTHNNQVDISAPGNYIEGILTGGGLIHKSGRLGVFVFRLGEGLSLSIFTVFGFSQNPYMQPSV